MRHGITVLVAALLVLPAAVAQNTDRSRVQVVLTDEGCPAGPDRFCIQPSTIHVDEDETIVIELVNRGRVEHNLTAAPGTPSAVAEHLDVAPLAPNGTATVTIPWEALASAREETEGAELTLQCGLEGHAALGERLTVQIGDPEAQRPQPGVGAVVAVAAIAGAAVVLRQRSA